MSNKSVPFSVRLSADDAAFVASLEVPGAITPSDKIRHIISEARLRSHQKASVEELAARFHEEFRPAQDQLKSLEREQGSKSELLDYVGNWLTTLCGEYAAGPASKDDLLRYEARIARLVAKLTEQLVRMSVTSDAACYDPQVVKNNIQRTIELTEFIRNQNRGDVSNA